MAVDKLLTSFICQLMHGIKCSDDDDDGDDDDDDDDDGVKCDKT